MKEEEGQKEGKRGMVGSTLHITYNRRDFVSCNCYMLIQSLFIHVYLSLFFLLFTDRINLCTMDGKKEREKEERRGGERDKGIEMRERCMEMHDRCTQLLPVYSILIIILFFSLLLNESPSLSLFSPLYLRVGDGVE